MTHLQRPLHLKATQPTFCGPPCYSLLPYLNCSSWLYFPKNASGLCKHSYPGVISFLFLGLIGSEEAYSPGLSAVRKALHWHYCGTFQKRFFTLHSAQGLEPSPPRLRERLAHFGMGQDCAKENQLCTGLKCASVKRG